MRGERVLWGVVIILGVLFFVVLGVSLFAKGEGVAEESYLLGKEGPKFEVENLYGEGDVVRGLEGEVWMLNFFASWCVVCRAEHALLDRIDVPLVGIAWKDGKVDAIDFLRETGNPYESVGFDGGGKVGVLWGLRGLPESYVMDREGKVRYHKVGAITPKILEEEIEPLLESLR